MRVSHDYKAKQAKPSFIDQNENLHFVTAPDWAEIVDTIGWAAAWVVGVVAFAICVLS